MGRLYGGKATWLFLISFSINIQNGQKKLNGMCNPGYVYWMNGLAWISGDFSILEHVLNSYTKQS